MPDHIFRSIYESAYLTGDIKIKMQMFYYITGMKMKYNILKLLNKTLN